MEKSPIRHFDLFKSTFFLSAFTFGGGYVIVPMMKKKFVDEVNWLEEEEMLNIAAIAQSSPGAMAVNASILVGWRLMGLSGALVAIIGTILPPFIILSVVSWFYASFRDNALVSAVLKGMMAGVCAVIFDVVITMGGRIVQAKKLLPILIMLGAFVAHYILRINIIYIIVFSGTLGTLITLHDKRTERENI